MRQLGLLTLMLLAAAAPAAGGTICAKVKLELLQKTALERVAFDARLGISNNLANSALSEVSVVIAVKDAAGLPADGLFFLKIGSMTAITAVNGTGVIQPLAAADVRWLIIPSTGAGGAEPSGKSYYVKATVNFKANGYLQSLTTFDAQITVMPQPYLRLQYVLPHDVAGDDPLTGEIEPSEPYYLGVRVLNAGAGPAYNLTLDAPQVSIVSNQENLAVGFKILGTFVGTSTVADTLRLSFGDLAPAAVKLGSWRMLSGLRGRFTDFTASFTHDPGLGGSLTSLIGGVSTYWLIKDVLDERPGRDSHYDFLLSTAGTLSGGHPEPHQLFSSDVADPLPVARISSAAVSLTGTLLSIEPVLQMSFAAPSATGFYYITAQDPTQGEIELVEALRSDGRRLNARNFWQNSPYYRPDEGAAPNLIRIFDYNPTGSYTLVFRKAELDAAPDAVAALSAAAAGGGEAALAWTSPGADRSSGIIYNGRYALQHSTDPAAAFSTSTAQIAFSTTTPAGVAQSLVLPGLAGNATYFFRLWTADDNLNWSELSNGATVLTLPYPCPGAQITDLSTGDFTAAWSTTTNLSGTSYRLELSTLPAGSVIAAAGFDPDFSSHVFTGLDPNTTYYLAALARNSADAATAAVIVSTVVTLAQQPAAAAAPLTAIHVSSAAAAWQTLANPASTRYEVMAATAPDSAPLAARSFTGVSSGEVTGLRPDTAYFFSVRAVNHAGVPADSTLLGSSITRVNTPQGFISLVSPADVTVTWTASDPDNPGTTPYAAELSTAPDFTGIVYSSAAARADGSAAVGGLSSDTTYYARLSAVSAAHGPSTVWLGQRYTAQVFAPGSAPGVLGIGADSIEAAWGTAANAPGTIFTLEASNSDGFIPAAASSTTALSTAALAGLIPNTTYYLRVNAGIGGSSSSFVALGVAVTHAAAPEPAPVPVTNVYSSSITAAWAYIFTVRSFELEASTAPDFTGILHSSVTTNSRRLYLTVSQLEHNTTYYLRAAAFNWQGVSTFTVLGSTRTTLPAPAPAAQTLLALSSAGIRVQWESNGNEPGILYTLEASTAADFTGAAVASATTDTAALLAGLADDTTYYMRVSASEDGVRSATLELEPVSTLTAPPAVPADPFPGVFATSVTVAWAALERSHGYRLEASKEEDFSPAMTSTTHNAALSTLTVAGLDFNTTYYFRVGALNHADAPNYTLLGSTRTFLEWVPPANVRFTTYALSTASLSLAWELDSPLSEAPLAVLARDPDFTSIVASATLAVGAQQKVYTGLAVNTTYFFKVKVSTFVDAGYSAAVASPTLAAPAQASAAPISNIGETSINVAWTQGANPPGTRYRLDYSSASFDAAATIMTDALSETLAGLVPNTTYFTRIAAVSHAGLPAAALAAPAASTLALPPGRAAADFTEIFGTSVTVQWIPRPSSPQSQTCEGYRVEASTAPDFPMILAGAVTADPAAAGLTIAGLIPNATHFFRVGSLNWAGTPNFLVLGSSRPQSQTHAAVLIARDEEATLAVIPRADGDSIIERVSVHVPPNILPPDILLTTDGEPANVPPPVSAEANLTFLGGAVEIGAGGAQPKGDVLIKYKYNPARLPQHIPASQIKAAFYDRARGKWSLLPSRTDATNAEVTALTSHFTLFAAFGVLSADDLNSVTIMPIPWQPGSGNQNFDTQAVYIRKLPFPAKITVYNLLGERVWRGEGDATGSLDWPGVNDAGRRVGSGVYPVVIEGAGKSIKKRVVVIR